MVEKTKKHGVIIRMAREDDSDIVFSLAQGFSMNSKVIDKEKYIEYFKNVISDDSAWLGVAEIEDEVIGYFLGFDHFSFLEMERVSWIEEIVIKVLMRKKGAGRDLVKNFEKWAISRGSKKIGLKALRGSSFFAVFGFNESAMYYEKDI